MEDIDDQMLSIIRDARRQAHALHYWIEGLAKELNDTGEQFESKERLAKKLFEQLIERIR